MHIHKYITNPGFVKHFLQICNFFVTTNGNSSDIFTITTKVTVHRTAPPLHGIRAGKAAASRLSESGFLSASQYLHHPVNGLLQAEMIFANRHICIFLKKSRPLII